MTSSDHPRNGGTACGGRGRCARRSSEPPYEPPSEPPAEPRTGPHPGRLPSGTVAAIREVLHRHGTGRLDLDAAIAEIARLVDDGADPPGTG